MILVSCEGFVSRIKKYVPDAEISFVPNWSLVDFRPIQKRKLPGRFNFTFAGNVGKVQNLENVILGFARFVKNYPDACLNIIGDGSFLGELKRIVQEKNVMNVNFEGRKPLLEMSDYYQASDVLIISLKDVPLFEIMIPSKFQAYLATCKPIYAILNGEVSYLVEKYHIGLCAHPSDVNGIAGGFANFMQLSREKLADMAANSVCLLESVFDKEKIIRKINTIFWQG